MDKNLERLGRRSEEIESVRAIERRKYAIERTNVRAPKKRSNAPAFVRKRGDRSQCDLSQPECERSHLCVKPKSAAALFWKFLILGCCNSLLHKDSNLTIFRVSRILLESINRPVNTEDTHTIFGEEFTAFKEAIFRVYSFPLFYFMKMISINFMCN
jgi:hypothetical protein